MPRALDRVGRHAHLHMLDVRVRQELRVILGEQLDLRQVEHVDDPLHLGHVGLQAGYMGLQAGCMGLQVGHVGLQAGCMGLQGWGGSTAPVHRAQVDAGRGAQGEGAEDGARLTQRLGDGGVPEGGDNQLTCSALATVAYLRGEQGGAAACGGGGDLCTVYCAWGPGASCPAPVDVR